MTVKIDNEYIIFVNNVIIRLFSAFSVINKNELIKYCTI